MRYEEMKFFFFFKEKNQSQRKERQKEKWGEGNESGGSLKWTEFDLIKFVKDRDHKIENQIN